MERANIEYKSTSEVTGEVRINGQKVRAKSFTFEHDVDGVPTATIEFVDPNVNITTIDSMVYKYPQWDCRTCKHRTYDQIGDCGYYEACDAIKGDDGRNIAIELLGEHFGCSKWKDSEE